MASMQGRFRPTHLAKLRMLAGPSDCLKTSLLIYSICND